MAQFMCWLRVIKVDDIYKINLIKKRIMGPQNVNPLKKIKEKNKKQTLLCFSPIL